MLLHYRPDKRPRRHDLVFVTRQGWHAALESHSELVTDPLVAEWIRKGWPLVARRNMPGEPYGVPLGLPLPPFAGKRRIALVMQPEAIVSVASPVELGAVSRVAPHAWRNTLSRLRLLAAQHAVTPRVCGSLAWQALTGMDYVTAESDLDVLMYVGSKVDALRLLAGMARIEARAPMRVDGELVREDGAAVNWRELRGGAREVLLKSVGSIDLVHPQSFLSRNLNS